MLTLNPNALWDFGWFQYIRVCLFGNTGSFRCITCCVPYDFRMTLWFGPVVKSNGKTDERGGGGAVFGCKET